MTTSERTKTNAADMLTSKNQKHSGRERIVAEVGLSPIVRNANTAMKFAQGTFGALEPLALNEFVDVMQEKVAKVKSGDLSDVEATLTAQATTLDAIFNELARRAALSMGTHIPSCETYLRMALKSQAQCRATLETLAEVKNPKPATFVRQQNVAYQQQVNNGTECPKETSTRAQEKFLNQSLELLELEAQHGERLVTRKTGKASGDDSHMAAVEKIYRPPNQRRQAAQ